MAGQTRGRWQRTHTHTIDITKGKTGRVPYITIQQMENYNTTTHTRSRNLDVGGRGDRVTICTRVHGALSLPFGLGSASFFFTSSSSSSSAE